MASETTVDVFDELEDSEKIEILVEALRSACGELCRRVYDDKRDKFYSFIQDELIEAGHMCNSRCNECWHSGYTPMVVRGVMDCDPEEYYCEKGEDYYYYSEAWDINDQCPKFRYREIDDD